MAQVIDTKQKINTRESGTELFKVIGILLVVISHVVQTLGSNFSYLIGFSDYCISLGAPTTDIQLIIVYLLRYSGALGNAFFFVASAWYLLDKTKTNTQKVLRMIVEIFLISVLWLGVTAAFTNFKLSDDHIKKSFFPTYYSNTWYLTDYIKFCFVFPFLNIIIKSIKQNIHFIIGMVLFIMYGVLAFFTSVPLECTFILWITLYVLIAYFKMYCPKFNSSFLVNLIIFIVALACHIGLVVGTNSYGLKHPLEAVNSIRWNSNLNTFLILIAYSLFNIFRNLKIKSKFINLVSSLSMLVYILHENIIFRQYYRPVIWHWIYINLGYKLLLLWTICYVVLLFLASCAIAYLYKRFIQKYVFKISDVLHNILMKGVNFIVSKLMLIFK